MEYVAILLVAFALLSHAQAQDVRRNIPYDFQDAVIFGLLVACTQGW
jgi:hypothetical protein